MDNKAQTSIEQYSQQAELDILINRQKSAFLNDGFPSLKTRVDRLDRLKDAHIRFKDRIVEALNEDFGTRPHGQSLATDVLSTVVDINDTRKEIGHWMKPQRRKVPLPMKLTGGRAELQFQPMGVIGNISPWNFPVHLAFSPAVGAMAAGNRVMLKPSEVTPNCSNLIAEMVASAFDPEEMAVVTGGVEVSQNFSKLPFDHLVFTGGPEVAKHVMRSAADNLVPVTLELGGKCPVVMSSSANLEVAADRVITAKTVNSGQLCLTPDYVLLPEGKVDEFVDATLSVLGKCYKSLLDNPDYTAVINERHWQRLNGYIEDINARGTRVEVFNPAGENFDCAEKHKLPIRLVIDPADDSLIMQEEVFGPMLSIKTYRSIEEAIQFINAKPRPLALYYFGKNKSEIREITQRTTSGGVTINDCVQHAACHDLPLAGVGNSGMGAYHGHHGFLEFSHSKAVYHQGLLSLGKFIRPPYGSRKVKMIGSMLK